MYHLITYLWSFFVEPVETNEQKLATMWQDALNEEIELDNGEDQEPDPSVKLKTDKEIQDELDDEEIKKTDKEKPHTVDAVRRRYDRFKSDQNRKDR